MGFVVGSHPGSFCDSELVSALQYPRVCATLAVRHRLHQSRCPIEWTRSGSGWIVFDSEVGYGWICFLSKALRSVPRAGAEARELLRNRMKQV